MIGRHIKFQLSNQSARNFASATYLHSPGRPRDASVTVCPGEGVGPSLVDSVLQLFDCLKVPLNYDMVDYSTLLRNNENKVLKKNKCVLMGPISNKSYEEESRGICHTQIMKELGVYTSIYNAITIPGQETKYEDLDILVIQQSEPGFPASIEYDAEYDDVSCMWITPYKKSKAIANYAFDNAILGKRQKVTSLHQSNIRKMWHGEFLTNMREVAVKHPKVKYDEMDIGEAAVELMKNPENFDLVVMPNDCGNIISNIAMSLVGGGGVVPSAHFGEKYTLFQQGSDNPMYDASSRDKANPTGLILASSMMLRQANLPCFADIIEDAIFNTYMNTDARTEDLGGNYNTNEFTQEVIKNIKKKHSDKNENSYNAHKMTQELA